MGTDPLIITLGDVPLPALPEGAGVVHAADVAEALDAAAGVRCPLFVADVAGLAALPASGLKIAVCPDASVSLPDDVIGALPIWAPDAASLALQAALATRSKLLAAEQGGERADEELEAFVHAVSHDLKGPLQGIIGLAGLLMQQAGVRVFPEVASFAERLESEADRLASMVTALTAFARLGRPRIACDVVSLSEVVDEVCAAAIGRHTERFPRFQVAPDLPTIRGDRALVDGAVAALIDNAIVFSDTSPPTIAIDAVEADDGVTLTIADQGIGMRDHALEQVFEMFTRLDKRRGDGLGVGLPMARRATELQGGTLRLTSEPGGGTTAHLTLPAGS
jgi:signal transduction histidine kinase